MNYDDQALNVLANEIQKAVEHSVSAASFDKTVDGRIVSLLGNGKYIVKINGSDYTVPVYGDSTFEVNEVVKVAIPQNDFKKMYIMPKGSNGGGGPLAEIDPTVPAWAKAPDKPSYTASEVGAEPSITKKTAFNKNYGASVSDLKMNGSASAGSIDGIARIDHVHPTDTSRASASDLNSHVDDNDTHVTVNEKNNWNNAASDKHTHGNKSVLDSITTVLIDTWNSAVSHISDTVKHITSSERTLWNTVSNKVDKIQGKQLSTEDYTSAEKNKLSGITENANNYVHPSTHSPSIIVQDSNNRFVTDSEKSIWNNKQNALGYTPLNSTLKGSTNGVAELDETGKVPSHQLPLYVDDVIEGYYKSDDGKFYSNSGYTALINGESGKIYVALDTNITYRWSGSAYVEISPSLALGETSTTAYRGDRGKIAYDHSQTTHAPSNAQKNSDITKAEIEAKLTGDVATHTHTSSKIPDFATTVRATVLTGLSNATNTIITATDSVLGALGKLQAQVSNVLNTLTSHIDNISNPHGVTKLQIGLGNVDNTTDNAKNVASAILSGDNTMKVYPERNNEVNFGGTNNSGDVYFGYRAKDSKSIPTNFIFGSSTATSIVKAKTFRNQNNVEVSYDGHTHSNDTLLSLSTEKLSEPTYVGGGVTLTGRSMFDILRGDRTAFLPASQIIIEKSTDAGVTWEDAGVADSNKVKLFTGQRPSISIPLKNGVKSTDCAIRVTITGMRYNVPAGTAETEKYNYWNPDNALSTERYCTFDIGWIWLTSNSDKIYCKVERATGANPNVWYADSEAYMSGWSGGNQLKLSSNTFGGGISQASNWWNWRFVFRTCSPSNTFNDADLSTSSQNSSQAIHHIKANGRNAWTTSNNLMRHDHLYNWDEAQHALFPASVQGTQLKSTVSSGTPPLTVNSNTVVNNLNADKLDGQDGSYYAPLASPALTGTPTAPTPSSGDNSKKIATTEYVQGAMSSAGTGDMLKSAYDANNNGIVDNSERLGGIPSEKFVTFEPNVPTTTNPINADLLQGRSANDFFLKTDNTILKKNDVIDDLNNSSSNLPLSALQGKVLKESIDTSNADIQSLQNTKANLTSPTFNGTPKIAVHTTYTSAHFRNVMVK